MFTYGHKGILFIRDRALESAGNKTSSRIEIQVLFFAKSKGIP